MSDKYTRGKLYQLTRSPDVVHAEQGSRGRRICCTASMGDHEENEGNARRIVACWNACDGIPTEKLEKAAGDPTPVFQLLMEASAERDKLRAALEQLQVAIRDGAGLDELTRMAGPSPLELEQAQRRCQQMDKIAPECEFGEFHPSEAGRRARERYDRIAAVQAEYENRYY